MRAHMGRLRGLLSYPALTTVPLPCTQAAEDADFQTGPLSVLTQSVKANTQARVGTPARALTVERATLVRCKCPVCAQS